MDSLHRHLIGKYKWYKNWHKHPFHGHFHWLTFIFTVFVIGVVFINIVNKKDVTQAVMTQNAESNIKSLEIIKGKVKGEANDRILIQFKKDTGQDNEKEILGKYN